MMLRGMLIVFFSLVTGALTANHWVVTNHGRIEANLATEFNMAQGHDLVQFLRQEDRVAYLVNMETSMKKTDPEVVAAPRLVAKAERLFYDEQCLLAHELTKWQLVVPSALLITGVDISALIGRPGFDPDDTVENPLRPSCGDDLLALPFSMHAFEHLDSMRDRGRLSGGRAHDDFVPDDFVTAKMFGHHVAQAMYKHNGTSDMWAVYVLATQYWRMEGNTKEAIECARRALHVVPRTHSIVPLLDVANILLDARRADDAIVVLDALLAVNETVSEAYCKSGEAYAMSDMPNYNASLYSFDACLLLKEGAKGAVRTRQYVLCQLHILHERGDVPINEKDVLVRATDAYLTTTEQHIRGTQLIDARDALTTHTMKERDIIEHEVLYDWHTTGGPPCYVDKSKNTQHKMTCPIGNRQPPRPNPPETDDSTPRRPRDRQPTASDDPATYLENVRKANISNREWFTIGTARYPLMSVDHLFPSDWVFQDEAWPSTVLCRKSKATLPRRSDIPSLFVTADSKGYSMRDVLVTRLLLDGQTQHSLPWLPPRCGSPADVPLVDGMVGVQRLQTLHHNDDGRYAEPQLTLALTNVTGTMLDSLHDIGQRLLTARKLAIAPKWLIDHTSALYWRVRGAPNEAVACLRGVLNDGTTPNDIRAASLNQLAQLVDRLGGRLDNAFVLIKMAQDLDPFEPAHHLLAALYSITADKPDLPWASEQLRAALDLDPLFPAALSTLRAVKCTLKDHPVKQSSTASKMRTSKNSKSLPAHFCLRLTDEKMGCVTMDRGTSVEHPWSRSPTDVTCVRPPQLLSMFIAFYERVIDGNSDDEVNAHQSSIVLSSFDRHVRYVAYERALAICHMAGYPWTSKHVVGDERADSSVVDTSDEVALDHDNSDQVLSPATQVHVDVDEMPPMERVTPVHSVEGVQATTAHTSDAPVNVRVLTAIDVAMPTAIPRALMEDVLAGVPHIGELPSTHQQCAQLRHDVQLDQATSTWLSVTANGINLADYIDFNGPIGDVHAKPYCPQVDRPGMFTMEHLAGADLADDLLGHYQAEYGLRDALERLGGGRQATQEMGARIAMAMSKSSDIHWTVSTVASLYWRMNGDARQAIHCLKHSLDASPNNVREVTLVSLANVYHQLSLLHSALIAGGAAMDTSPRLVVIHFTLANIYSALGDIDMALDFYMSTLALQHNFEPARQRIHAVYCMTAGVLPEHIEQALLSLEKEGKRNKRHPFPN